MYSIFVSNEDTKKMLSTKVVGDLMKNNFCFKYFVEKSIVEELQTKNQF